MLSVTASRRLPDSAEISLAFFVSNATRHRA